MKWIVISGKKKSELLVHMILFKDAWNEWIMHDLIVAFLVMFLLLG